MAIDTDQLATDLGNIITDLPTTFTYAGANYTGVLTDLTQGKNLEEGGFVSEYDAELYARQSVFGTLPSSGVTIGIANTVYRVERVVKSPDGAGIRLDLITPDK